MCDKLRTFTTLHSLEVMWKPSSPVITAKTKAAKPKEIPVNHSPSVDVIKSRIAFTRFEVLKNRAASGSDT
jgi:hypothetical protein